MGDKYLKNSIISFILILSTVLTPVAFIPHKAEAQGMSAYVSGLGTAATQLPLCKGNLGNGIKYLFTNESAVLQRDLKKIQNKLTDRILVGGGNAVALKLIDAEQGVPVTIEPEVKDMIESTKIAAEETQVKMTKLELNDTCLKSIGRMMIKMLLQKITLSTVEWINSGYDGSPMFVEEPLTFFGDIAKNEILQFGIEIGNPDLYPFGKAFMQNQAMAVKNKFADNAQYSLNELIQNTTPEYSATTFSLDFSQGGWGAWDALTQVPANNPLGFNLMASNELQKRLEGTSQSVANTIRDGLREAGGYLGSERCVDPSGVTREEHEEALRTRSVLTGARACIVWNPAVTYGDVTIPRSCQLPLGVTEEENARAIVEQDIASARICNRWEYVTPGKMVADAATKVMNYPDNNLLKADDLNDAVAAILDAVLNNFATDLMSDSGFAGLGDSATMMAGADGTFIANEGLYGDDSKPWTEEDFPGSLIAGSSFLQQNPNFNIREDLNQALIDEQRIFIDKLREQNKELKSNIPVEGSPRGDRALDKEYTGNYGLIPVINQLDYCIPGPHPGWEIDSRNALNAAISTVVPETEETLKDRNSDAIKSGVKMAASLGAAAAGAAIGAAIGSGVPVVGTIIGAVIGAAVGWAVDKIGSAEKKLHNYYAGIYAAFIGLVPDVSNDEKNNPALANVESKQAVSTVLHEILSRYTLFIQDIYNPSKLPSVATEAAQKFNLGKGYAKMFENNEERIVSMNSLITRLEEIKKEIDTLNKELKDKTIKDVNGNIAPLDTIETSGVLGQYSQYEENLQPWISAFGRLSSEMVNGDDIAEVDNLKKEIVDERDYIYKNLLKGPNGCEKDLELEKGRDEGSRMHMKVYETKRITYPMPILYDYNAWTAADKDIPLPDPFNSGYTDNKMVQNELLDGKSDHMAFNSRGPSFLSFINMRQGSYCNGETVQYSKPPYGGPGWFTGCMTIDDLLPFGEGDWAPLGIRGNTGERDGTFETMIGIY